MLSYEEMYYNGAELEKLFAGDTLLWRNKYIGLEYIIAVYELNSNDDPVDIIAYLNATSEVYPLLHSLEEADSSKRYKVRYGRDISETGFDRNSHTLGYLTNLVEVELLAPFTSIAGSYFYGCTALKKVTLPSSVLYIEPSVFYDCTALTDVNIPSQVSYIGNTAFYNSGLTGDIVIPSTCSTIGYGVFSYTNISSMTISNGVQSIGANICTHCLSLESIVFPNTITTIDRACYECSSLTNVAIPENITSISNNAFSYCTSLTQIYIPSSMTTIHTFGFSSCDGITIYVDKLPDTIPNSPWGATNATVVWRGLEPYGASWNLYSKADDAEKSYLLPGIFLHSPSTGIAFNFTCAESPEKIDFTLVKRVRAYGEFIPDSSWGLLGGIAALSYSHSTHLNESITATRLDIASQGSEYVDLDCKYIGGNQILLLYADTGARMTFTEIEFQNYDNSNIADLSEEVWEQRNYQYESTTTITCNLEVNIPNDVSSITVHSLLTNGASKSCAVFSDANGEFLSYGDGWQGNEMDTDHLCSHYQTIPSGAASVAVAIGYSPDMTTTVTPQELDRCVICFD